MISWTIRFQLILLQFGDFNKTVIIVLTSLKAFKISDAHDVHSIVFRTKVKSGNVADNALSENNLQKYFIASLFVYVTKVNTKVIALAPTNVQIKANLLAGNIVSCSSNTNCNAIIRDQIVTSPN